MPDRLDPLSRHKNVKKSQIDATPEGSIIKVFMWVSGSASKRFAFAKFDVDELFLQIL